MSHTPSLTRFTGFPGGVIINGVPILSTYGANVYWVDGVNGQNGHKGTRSRPWKTVNYALTVFASQTSQYNNATLMVVEGHTEKVSDATTFLMSTIGTKIVGLGVGDNRPTFTFDTGNTSTITCSAAGNLFQNCIFVANFLSIAAPFTLTTAKGFTLQDCLFRETGNTLDFLNCVKSTGAANTIDGIRLVGNQWASQGTTSVNTFLLSANDIDRCTILDNKWQTPNVTDQAIGLVVTAGVVTNLDFGWNYGQRKSTGSTNGSLVNISGGTTSTGWIHHNFMLTAGSGDTLALATAGFGFFENYITDVNTASGVIMPARDS